MSNQVTLRTAALGAALVASLVAPARADELTVPSNHDNTLIETPAVNSNGGGDGIYAGRVQIFGGETIRRALFSFDLSAIPTSATVDSAIVTLTMVQAATLATPLHTVHRVNASWGEGIVIGGGQGNLAAPGDVTWTERLSGSSSWATAGGDFVTTPSATVPIAEIGAYAFTSPGVVADVQAWVSSPASNFGWVMRGDESQGGTVKKFSSREGFNPPTLRVVYRTSNAGVGQGSPARVTFAAPSPSPSTGPVRLAFALPRAAHVSLDVLDATGRVVRSLAGRAEYGAGSHALSWDARNAVGQHVPAGVYFATLNVDGETLVRRIPVLR